MGGSLWAIRGIDRYSLVIAGGVLLVLLPASLLFYILSVVQGKRRPPQAQRWKQRLHEYGLYLLLWRFGFVMGALLFLAVVFYLGQALGWRLLAA
jgi:hypothetical protein